MKQLSSIERAIQDVPLSRAAFTAAMLLLIGLGDAVQPVLLIVYRFPAMTQKARNDG